MYRLIGVAGPNRGSMFTIGLGETTIGRKTGNTIVLPSTKVSKNHCAIEVRDDEVLIRDLGSSNGTFVNGVLVKAKRLQSGDRLGIGEFVFEFKDPSARPRRVATGALQLDPPAAPDLSGNLGLAASAGQVGSEFRSPQVAVDTTPKDFKGRMAQALERLVMPVFYRINLKTDLKLIVIGLIAATAGLSVMLSSTPLMELNQQVVMKESGRLAQFIAREMAQRNSVHFASGELGKSEIGLASRYDSVRLAAIVDLDGRIVVPAQRAGQLLAVGRESAVVIRSLDVYRKGERDTGLVRPLDESTVIAIEPVKVVSQQFGRNVVAGAAVVSLDVSAAGAQGGELGVLFSEGLIYAGVVAFGVVLILLRLIFKPFEVLNEDIDRVLKGEIRQVTHEFRISNLDSLWDVINSALQRIPPSGSSAMGSGGLTDEVSGEDFLGPMKTLAMSSTQSMLVLDANRLVVFLNPAFEDLSGVRVDQAQGRDLGSVARDVSFGPFISDLLERAHAQGDATENYEFSGVVHRIVVGAVRAGAGRVAGYFISAIKADG